jgi:hypothetical protein
MYTRLNGSGRTCMRCRAGTKAAPQLVCHCTATTTGLVTLVNHRLCAYATLSMQRDHTPPLTVTLTHLARVRHLGHRHAVNVQLEPPPLQYSTGQSVHG